MSRPQNDTLTPRNNGNFPIVDGPLQARGLLRADFPAPGIFPPGTALAASDEAYRWYTNTDGTAWAHLGSSGLPDPSLFVDGCVPVVRSGVWTYDTRLTEDDIDPGFSITGFSGTGSYVSSLELGQTMVNPSFSASYSSPVASATINDGSGALALGSPYTSFSYSGGNAKTYFSNTQTTLSWTLSAHGKTSVRSTSVNPRVFYDVAVPGTYNASFIAALTGQALAGSFPRTITYGDPGGTKKLYYAFPTAFGTPSHFKDANLNLDQPWSKVASAVAVTNGFSVTVNYDLWASDNILTVPFTIAVS